MERIPRIGTVDKEPGLPLKGTSFEVMAALVGCKGKKSNFSTKNKRKKIKEIQKKTKPPETTQPLGGGSPPAVEDETERWHPYNERSTGGGRDLGTP